MRRRKFLHAAGLGAAAVAAHQAAGQGEAAARPAVEAAQTPPVAVEAAAGARPNVILIFTDDQGTVDAGCYGSADLETPAIDALAARGTRFTQFYAAAPICSPSRAALLTGRYPLRCGVTGNAPAHRGMPGGLPVQEITLAQMFKAAGYATGHIGKWHLGYTPEQLPNARGFDYSFGHMAGCIDNWSHFYFWAGPNVHDLHRNGEEIFEDGRFFPDLCLEEAGKFITANRDRPFFLYYASNQPHYPYQADVKWLRRLKDLPYPRNLYAAALATMDERIGGLLRHVEESGLGERTIVVFMSDNGHSLEERSHFGGGSAGRFRGEKFSMFEGGIRVPAIISWPGRLPQGAVRDQPAHACDWLPTLAELCGVKAPGAGIDGRSLCRVIADAAAPPPHDVLHWHIGAGKMPHWAVRLGRWKLISNAPDPGPDGKSRGRIDLFLADLEADPGETTNRAAENPEVVARLRKLHDDWAAGAAPAG